MDILINKLDINLSNISLYISEYPKLPVSKEHKNLIFDLLSTLKEVHYYKLQNFLWRRNQENTHIIWTDNY